MYMYQQYLQIWGFCSLGPLDSLDKAARLSRQLEGDTGSLKMFVSLQWSIVLSLLTRVTSGITNSNKYKFIKATRLSR